MKTFLDSRDGRQLVRFLEFSFFIPPRTSGVAATKKIRELLQLHFINTLTFGRECGGPAGIFLLTWVFRAVVGEGSRALFSPGRPAADPDSDSVGEGGSAMSSGRYVGVS